jgi:hypothetical protein
MEEGLSCKQDRNAIVEMQSMNSGAEEYCVRIYMPDVAIRIPAACLSKM